MGEPPRRIPPMSLFRDTLFDPGLASDPKATVLRALASRIPVRFVCGPTRDGLWVGSVAPTRPATRDINRGSQKATRPDNLTDRVASRLAGPAMGSPEVRI